MPYVEHRIEVWFQWLEEYLGLRIPNPAIFEHAASSWLTSIFVASLVFVICRLLRNRIARRFGVITTRLDQIMARVMIAVSGKTQTAFVAIVSIYIGLLNIDLAKPRENFITKFTVVTVIIQCAIWLATGVRVWVEATLDHRTDMEGGRKTTLTALGMLGRMAVWIFALVLCLDNLGFNISALVAGLGIGGVAVALAVQNILGDLLASLSITLDQPFVVGDAIALDDLAGTVEHVGLKTTRVRAVSGELLILANGDLLRSRVRNFRNITERRCLMRLEIAGDTAVDKLQKIPEMLKAIISERPKTRFERAQLLEIVVGSLVFEVVYFVADAQFQFFAATRHEINIEVIRKLRAEGIALTAPSTVVPAKS